MISSPQRDFKPNLDLLRTIAVCFVVADHVMLSVGWSREGPGTISWIGVLGVYLFFVHTCLVLMWSLDRKPHIVDFYVRRAFRIYPLAIVAVCATLVLHLRQPPSFANFSTFDGLTVASNLLLVENITLRPDILGVFWSLPLEVDMYLVLPVLYFFVRKNMVVWPLLMLSAFTIALTPQLWLVRDANVFVTVIPCFLMGIVAYVGFNRIRPRLPAWAFPVFLAAVTVFFMLYRNVGAAYPTCLLVGLGLPWFAQLRSPVLSRLCHEVAKYSYGIYLGHLFALSLAFFVLRGWPLPLQFAVAIAVVAVVAVAGYHLIEKPMIDIGTKVAARVERRYELAAAD